MFSGDKGSILNYHSSIWGEGNKPWLSVVVFFVCFLKRLPTPQPSPGIKPSLVGKAGSPGKAAGGALKGKDSESESSTSSDSEEDEAAQKPPPNAGKILAFPWYSGPLSSILTGFASLLSLSSWRVLDGAAP